MVVMGTRLPESIGRYAVEAELGRGTMGIVYKARDPRNGGVVALKTISPMVALSDAQKVAFENRFFAEGRIASGLCHPGIVKVLEMGRDPGSRTLFLALEYLEGETLQDVIEGGPIPWREALALTRGVADALHHAHSRGVVHRDVKPANIMRLVTGDPKVMDFGLARLESARFAPTLTGQLFGTPLYMSPEQAQGETVDARSDLFSLGAILYTLLTGRRAFGADSIPAIMKRIVYEDPVPPSRLVAGLPIEIDAIVGRMMAKPPARRHPSGHAVAMHIDEVLAARPAARPGVAPTPVKARADVSPLKPHGVFEPADVADIEQLFERLWMDASGTAATLPLPLRKAAGGRS